jgi:hypothetical protein
MAPGPGVAGLAEDLWQIVATHMTLRDWARTSGTCHLLHRLPLSVVRVGDPFNEHKGMLHQGAPVLPHALQGRCWRATCEHLAKCIKEASSLRFPLYAGLEWASRRWSVAYILHLELDDEGAEQLAAACTPAGMQLRHLKELHFYCRAHSDTCRPMLAWLLSKASHIEALSCRSFRKLFYFPPLAYLKHLMLNSTDFSSLSRYLPLLLALETLHLDGHRETYMHEDDGLFSNAAHLPSLDLRSNIRLSHIAFQIATVGRLHIPDACKVSFIVMDEDYAGQASGQLSWAYLEPVLHSLSWTCFDSMGIVDMQRLQMCSALSYVNLVVHHRFGDAGMPVELTGHLARLKCLVIHAFEVHVVVPAYVEWKAFRVVACGGGLHLTMQDVQSFASTTAAFVLSGQGLDTSGVRQALQEALSAAGKSWDESLAHLGVGAIHPHGPGIKYPEGLGLRLSGCNAQPLHVWRMPGVPDQEGKALSQVVPFAKMDA